MNSIFALCFPYCIGLLGFDWQCFTYVISLLQKITCNDLNAPTGVLAPPPVYVMFSNPIACLPTVDENAH